MHKKLHSIIRVSENNLKVLFFGIFNKKSFEIKDLYKIYTNNYYSYLFSKIEKI